MPAKKKKSEQRWAIGAALMSDVSRVGKLALGIGDVEVECWEGEISVSVRGEGMKVSAWLVAQGHEVIVLLSATDARALSVLLRRASERAAKRARVTRAVVGK